MTNDRYVERRGLALLASARREMTRAEGLLQSEVLSVQSPEKVARGAPRLFSSALNWLEDTSGFDSTHVELDEAGRWVRTTFGCTLAYRNGTYRQTCPVSIAHKRIGASAEIVQEFTRCLICWRDARYDAQCTHVKS